MYMNGLESKIVKEANTIGYFTGTVLKLIYSGLKVGKF